MNTVLQSIKNRNFLKEKIEKKKNEKNENNKKTNIQNTDFLYLYDNELENNFEYSSNDTIIIYLHN
jgi:hypothetical protein